jgi:hypothetical protein
MTYKPPSSPFEETPEGGYVRISWAVPDDPQVEFYRVYRCEVPSFKTQIDEAALEWTLVGDRVTAPQYTDPVEQSFAHYYLLQGSRRCRPGAWNQRRARCSASACRPQAAADPQYVAAPFQEGRRARSIFSAVNHCDRYEIYRTEIPDQPKRSSPK